MSNYDKAIELLGVEPRCMTKEESDKYEEAMNKLYKPIDINIMDLYNNDISNPCDNCTQNKDGRICHCILKNNIVTY